MSARRMISRLLFGLTVPQEYVCLSQEESVEPFSFYLTTKDDDVLHDITAAHLFLGYKPVIIGICVNDTNGETLRKHSELCISVSNRSFQLTNRWKGYMTSKDTVARMILERIGHTFPDAAKVFLFRVTNGTHSFLSGFHQRMNNLKRKLKSPKNNAIPLEGNLADQVRIAYCIPRIVSVITLLTSTGKMNMFPTDLHGAMGNSFYLSSLRIGGKACEQVEKTETIVLADVQAESFNEVYSLGKNHMKEARPVSEFTTQGVSSILQTPLPENTTHYRELQVVSSIDIGIHRVFLYRILNDVRLQSSPRLSHIHQYAAQWRVDHNLPTHLLLRS